jgi:hypothetical protein
MTSKGGFIGAIFNAARFDRVDVDHQNDGREFVV